MLEPIPPIYKKILGYKVIEPEHEEKKAVYPLSPFLPKLNSAQKTSVQTAINNSLTIIQGPPGTGKTVTSAYIVYNLFQMDKEPVLVVAPSNVAIGELTKKISYLGLKVSHIFSYKIRL